MTQSGPEQVQHCPASDDRLAEFADIEEPLYNGSKCAYLDVSRISEPRHQPLDAMGQNRSS